MVVNNFGEEFQFQQDSAASLYSQLAEHIKRQIKTGHLKPGDRIMPENAISEGLTISRTTVRLAMNILVGEGLIVRNRGKGSFVAQNKLRRNINHMYNFTENIRDSGAVPSSQVLQAGIRGAPKPVREALQLRDTMPVFHLKRLRCADDMPIISETTNIPYYLCPNIERIDFSSSSLYDILQSRYSLTLHHAVETIEAALIDSDTAKQLRCKGRMPGYRITRISYLDNGYPFEYTTSITRGDKCIFKLELSNSRDSGKNAVDFDRQLLP